MIYYVRNNYQSLVLKNESKQNMPMYFWTEGAISNNSQP